jgi:hypothetical protein
MLRMPRGAEREYIATYGIVAIYVAALPTGPTLVDTTRDLLRTWLAIRRRWLGVQITSALWVKDRSEAALIAREVNASIPHGTEGLLVATAKVAQRRIENVAAHMNIPLTDHDTVMARVRTAVQFVAESIDEAHAHGELAWFNTAFRAWRLEAKSVGRSMTYAEARARLRRVVTQRVLAGECHEVPAELLPAIFPALQH